MESENLTVFAFESAALRTVIKDGEPWFVAKDVCSILELNNVGQALARLDEDEKSTIILNDGTAMGNPNFSIINESGLYSLVLGSRKPQAKAFKKWVTSEVLPSIRKTGFYGFDPKWNDIRQLIALGSTPDKAYAEVSKALYLTQKSGSASKPKSTSRSEYAASTEAEFNQFTELLVETFLVSKGLRSCNILLRDMVPVARQHGLYVDILQTTEDMLHAMKKAKAFSPGIDHTTQAQSYIADNSMNTLWGKRFGTQLHGTIALDKTGNSYSITQLYGAHKATFNFKRL